MIRYLHSLSLRTKITASFVLIVVVGTATCVLLGSRIVTEAVLEQAHTRMRHGLETARLALLRRQDQVRNAVVGVADRPGAGTELPATPAQLDFLSVVRPGEPAPSPSVTRARRGETVAGAELVTPRGVLALTAAAPVREHDRVVAVVYGGVVLTGNPRATREIAQLVFGGQTSGGRDVGWVEIFRPTDRAPGRLPDEALRSVLAGEERWYGRTTGGGEPALTAFSPVRDVEGRPVAALGLGVLERPFLAARTRMMLSFLLVAIAGVVVLLLLTVVITRRTIHPLEQMVAATRRIAQGDFDRGVPPTDSGDEIGVLAGSFNQMLASIAAMRRQQEAWNQTLEERVRQRTAELAAVQAQMAQTEKMASLGSMAAGVAHELNNPMGGILSLSMVALDELPQDHPVRADLETISKQALRCRDIVRGLLDFSRQSASPGGVIDVADVVDKTLALLETQVAFQHVEVRRALDPDLPRVRIDPGQLQQVITNLALNAVDAMQERGTLTVSCRRGGADDVQLEVADTGSGIPDHVLPFIFDPFFTTKKVGKGTGLGLSIVHGIVTGAGGRIDVRTGTGGTAFTVVLPIAREVPDGETAGRGAGKSAAR